MKAVAVSALGMMVDAGADAQRLIEGTVALLHDGGRVAVQVEGGPAVVAQVTGAAQGLSVGDVVLVAVAGAQAYVLATLSNKAGVVVRLADGTRAERSIVDGEEKLRVTDAKGRCVFEYDATSRKSTVTVAEGDLALRAEQGAVSVYGARGVRIESPDEVSLESRHAVSIRHDEGSVRVDRRGVVVEGAALTVFAKRAEAVLDEVRSTVKHVDTTIEKLRQQVGVLETNAGRIVERARSTFREVEGVAQTRVGRLRVMAREAMHFSGKRASIVVEEDVKLDGKKILLG